MNVVRLYVSLHDLSLASRLRVRGRDRGRGRGRVGDGEVSHLSLVYPVSVASFQAYPIPQVQSWRRKVLCTLSRLWAICRLWVICSSHRLSQEAGSR